VNDSSREDKSQGRDVMIGSGLGTVAFVILLIVMGATAKYIVLSIVLILLAPILMLFLSRR